MRKKMYLVKFLETMKFFYQHEDALGYAFEKKKEYPNEVVTMQHIVVNNFINYGFAPQALERYVDADKFFADSKSFQVINESNFM